MTEPDETLDARARRWGGRLPTLEVLSLSDKLLDSLGVWHVQGMVHGDLRAENVLLMSDGRVALLNAQPHGSRSPAADLRAVGETMFSLIVGQPRSAVTRPGGAPPSLGALVPVLPPAVVELVDRALSVENSFPDASSLQNAIRQALLAMRQAAAVSVAPPELSSAQRSSVSSVSGPAFGSARGRAAPASSGSRVVPALAASLVIGGFSLFVLAGIAGVLIWRARTGSESQSRVIPELSEPAGRVDTSSSAPSVEQKPAPRAAPTGTTGRLFDNAEANSVLSTRASLAKSCNRFGGPFGTGSVQVAFGSGGNVLAVFIRSAPWNGTAKNCVDGAFRSARVKPFDSQAQTRATGDHRAFVTTSVTLDSPAPSPTPSPTPTNRPPTPTVRPPTPPPPTPTNQPPTPNPTAEPTSRREKLPSDPAAQSPQ